MEEIADIAAPTELAIVDVFTKLIFSVEQEWDAQELLIVQALRRVDHNVYMDGNVEMGSYLRALGVQEMIKLVAQVKRQMQRGKPFTVNAVSGSESLKPNL